MAKAKKKPENHELSQRAAARIEHLKSVGAALPVHPKTGDNFGSLPWRLNCGR